MTFLTYKVSNLYVTFFRIRSQSRAECIKTGCTIIRCSCLSSRLSVTSTLVQLVELVNLGCHCLADKRVVDALFSKILKLRLMSQDDIFERRK